MTAFLRPRFDTTTSPVRSSKATFGQAENIFSKHSDYLYVVHLPLLPEDDQQLRPKHVGILTNEKGSAASWCWIWRIPTSICAIYAFLVSKLAKYGLYYLKF